MKRSDLEHILRACKGTTEEMEFIVIGSQSILGRFPDAPRVLRQSIEADVYPRQRPDLAPLLGGNLGELSLFHQTHGYWVDGVAPTTATLPAGWEERLVKVCNDNTGGAIGWCLESHDLAFMQAGGAAGEGPGLRCRAGAPPDDPHVGDDRLDCGGGGGRSALASRGGVGGLPTAGERRAAVGER